MHTILKTKPYIFLLTLFLSVFNQGFAFSAEENPFLGKAFWKEQPNIESIEAEIAKGFSVTESNIHGFDAVC